MSNPIQREIEITIDTVIKAIKGLKPMPRQELWICTKHWKALKLKVKVTSTASRFMYLPFMEGLDVRIVPYLKKPRIVTYR